MKLTYRLSILLIALVVSLSVNAQNPLPDLSVRELTRGKIQISWYSPERNCIQVAVQRSTDSSKNFRTIISAQSPELMNNGYVDNKPPIGKAYYRIFYVIQDGSYFFTRAIMVETQPEAVVERPLPVMEVKKEKPVELTSIYIKNKIAFQLNNDEYKHFKDSINKTKDVLRRIDAHSVEWKQAEATAKTTGRLIIRVYVKDMLLTELDKNGYSKFEDSIKTNTKDTLFALDPTRIQLHPFIAPVIETVFVYRNDSLIAQLDAGKYKKFKDSIATRTKDTLFATDRNRIEIHPLRPKYVWVSSRYIYTNAKGYVTITLPLVKQHRYHVIFFEEDGSELFRIKSIKEPELVLDKIDFVHGGWFSFELFEDDKLKEKNKLFLAKD